MDNMGRLGLIGTNEVNKGIDNDNYYEQNLRERVSQLETQLTELEERHETDLTNLEQRVKRMVNSIKSSL